MEGHTMSERQDDIPEAADDQLLEDLAPDSDEAADVQGGWRYREAEPEEEDLQQM